MGTGNLTAAVELWPVVSRKVAIASALVKSETIFLFSSILCRRLYWLSMAQYLEQSTWIFNLYSVWQNGMEVYTYVHVWLFVVPFFAFNLAFNHQKPRSGIEPFRTIYLSENLSTNSYINTSLCRSC